MSQNHHANKGLPVVFNGQIARHTTSTRGKAARRQESAHLSDHGGITAQHDPGAGGRKLYAHALLKLAVAQ
jgi:hypothetical protein